MLNFAFRNGISFFASASLFLYHLAKVYFPSVSECCKLLKNTISQFSPLISIPTILFSRPADFFLCNNSHSRFSSLHFPPSSVQPFTEKAESFVAIRSDNHSAIQKNVELLTASFWKETAGITCRKV